MEVRHQGGKEETFIQTGRRSGNRQPGQRGQAARWQLEDQVSKVVDRAVPSLHVDKPGGTTGE